MAKKSSSWEQVSAWFLIARTCPLHKPASYDMRAFICVMKNEQEDNQTLRSSESKQEKMENTNGDSLSSQTLMWVHSTCNIPISQGEDEPGKFSIRSSCGVKEPRNTLNASAMSIHWMPYLGNGNIQGQSHWKVDAMLCAMYCPMVSACHMLRSCRTLSHHRLRCLNRKIATATI